MRSVAAGVILWSIVAAYLAWQSVMVRPLIDGAEVSWGEAIWDAGFVAVFWGLATILIKRLIHRHPVSRQNWLGYSVRHFGLAVCLILLFVLFYPCFGPEDFQLAVPSETYWERVSALWIATSFSGGLIFLVIFGICQSWEFFQILRTRELAAKQLEADLVTSRLNQLRSQLQPHFLFNTLSAITTLIHDDPDAAERTVVGLGELLRATLELPKSNKQTLSREIEFINKYVEIQSIRFPDRLTFMMDVDPLALDAQIPVLGLQPIVENAIKHGASASLEPCIVKLEIKVVDRKLKIVITDDGPGPRHQPWQEGVGLKNTRHRLEHLYGDQFSFQCKARDPGFIVEMILPFESDQTNE